MRLFEHNTNSEPLNERDRAGQQAELNQLIRRLEEMRLALKKDIKKRSLVESQLSNELNIGVLAAELVLKNKPPQLATPACRTSTAAIIIRSKTKKQHALLMHI